MITVQTYKYSLWTRQDEKWSNKVELLRLVLLYNRYGFSLREKKSW